MGVFDRMKRAVKSKANAAIDKARDPEKELELAIVELEEIRKQALQELLSYKTSAKKMEQDLERERKRAAEWEKRAMAAVKAGDDDLARKALREQKDSQAEIAKLERDRDQAAGYAIQLNRSRKTAETKLRMLKLRKGTLATQLRAGQTGSPLGVDDSLFDKFADAENAIDEDAIAAEVQAAMEGEDFDADFDRRLLQAGADPAAVAPDGEDPLAALKAKMAQQKASRPPAAPPDTAPQKKPTE